MVASKKVHCAYCNKKCSGNVLRYQDQYYHKQCFEAEQGELAAKSRAPELYVSGAGETLGAETGAGGQSRLPTRSASPSLASRVEQFAREDCEDGQQVFAQTPARGRQMLGAAKLQSEAKSRTIDARAPQSWPSHNNNDVQQRAATLPHSQPAAATTNGLAGAAAATCAACRQTIRDGQALIALDLHWHVSCFKCAQCKAPLHGEYVAKDGKAYCERDYQKLFGITCVYCKRFITGKVLQAGDAHHFHPSCARCSKCGDPFVPGEEMYLQGEVTWHPRCGPGPAAGGGGADASLLAAPDDFEVETSRSQRRATRSPTLSSRSRSASPFSFMSRQYGRSSPAYADSEALGDLSRVYTISYLNSDSNLGYLRRPLEPKAPKSPQFSRPVSASRLGGAASCYGAASDRSRCSSRSQQLYSAGRDRSAPPPRRMHSVLSSLRSGASSARARSPSMQNEDAIQLASYPSGQKPPPDSVPKIERDDFPAPPFPYPAGARQRAGSKSEGRKLAAESPPIERRLADEQQLGERASRPRSREFATPAAAAAAATNGNHLAATAAASDEIDSLSLSDEGNGEQLRKEEEQLSKIANGIGKIFLQTLREREKLRAWKRANLDPRNASRTPSATRELPSRMRYENSSAASPSRDLDRPRPWTGQSSAIDQADELVHSNEQRRQLERASQQSPSRTLSSLGRPSQMSAASSSYGYKVVQSDRATLRPGYGLTSGPYGPIATPATAAQTTIDDAAAACEASQLSFGERQRHAQSRAADLLLYSPELGQRQRSRTSQNLAASSLGPQQHSQQPQPQPQPPPPPQTSASSVRSLASAAHLRRSMPNVANLHHLSSESGPPKLYPYHLLATSNYRLPPDVDRCHLERHLSNEEFQYIFHCDRLDFYRLPEWRRNELKRRAKLF